MKRRDFLKATAGLAIAPTLPVWPMSAAAGQFDLDVLKSAVDQAANGQGPYWAFIHPNVEQDLRNMAARDAWRHAHWAYRFARRNGKETEQLDAKAILARYAAERWPLRSIWDDGPPEFPAEIGRFESVRFIRSESVAG